MWAHDCPLKQTSFRLICWTFYERVSKVTLSCCTSSHPYLKTGHKYDQFFSQYSSTWSAFDLGLLNEEVERDVEEFAAAVIFQ